MSTNTPRNGSHILPAWFEWLNRHVVLSFLILGELIVNFVLGAQVAVQNLADPGTWTWYQWLMVSVAFFVALAVSGVALKLSQTMADRFAEGRRLAGIFCTLGMLGYGAIDTWASIAERSLIVHPTPADTVLFDALGIHATAFTASTLFVSLMLPFSVIFVGFTNRPPAIEDDATWEQRQQRAVRAAEYKAARRKAAAEGLGSALAGGLRAAKTGLSGEQTEGAGLPPLPADAFYADGVSPVNGGPVSGANPGASGQRGTRARPSQSLPAGHWTSRQLIAWVAETYHYELSEQTAKETVRTLGSGATASGLPGQPYIARVRALKAWAARQGFAQSIRLVPPHDAATGTDD